MTDPLTGLRTRDGLRAELAAHPAVCCRVDIDGFAWVNDQEGHAEGDRVLAAVAKYLVTSLGEQARSICRVGGDEFLVVLRSLDLGAAGEIAAGIVSGVRALEIPYRRRDRPLRTVVEVNVVLFPAIPEFAAQALALPGTTSGSKDWVDEWIYREKLRSGCDAGVIVDLSALTPTITVGKLKQLLEKVPDDVVVALNTPPNLAPHDTSRLQAAWPSYRGGPIFSFSPAKRLSEELVVQDLIEIAGRGTAVLVDNLAEGQPGQYVRVEITRPDGSVLTAAASLELALWRPGTLLESFALLVDAKISEISSGAKLRVVDAGELPRT